MDDKTGIFTFTELIDKHQSRGQIDAMLDWARQSIAFAVRQAVIARILPERMYVVAMTALSEEDGELTIKVKQRLLIALSDWTEAKVGDCVVGEEDFDEAREVNFGEVWLFESYGLFPMVGPNASSTTRIKIYQRKR